MATVLQEYQYELIDPVADRSIVFGRNTTYTVAEADHGSPEETYADAPVSVGDGVRFGRDFINGRLITFEMNFLTPYTYSVADSAASSATALNNLDLFTSMWRNDWVRRKAGELCILRYRIGGRTRRVYGRPRKLNVTTGKSHQGWLPVTCEFQCVDDKYYADLPDSHNVPMIAASKTGLEFEFECPFMFNGSSLISLPSTFVVPGGVAAIPVFTINGPIINPTIQQVGGWRIHFPNLQLNQFQSVTIDPRHWKRTVLRNDGASVAGKMDAKSPAMSQMWLEPGEHEITLAGIDPTNLASLDIQVHSAYASY